MVGAGEVVQTFGPIGHIALPPFVKPYLAMVQTLTDPLYLLTRQAPPNSGLTVREFVVHSGPPVKERVAVTTGPTIHTTQWGKC